MAQVDRSLVTMGMIKVELSGSFPRQGKTFGPADHGHADGVAQVIEWLASEVLPEASALDHSLHTDGHDAPEGWVRER